MERRFKKLLILCVDRDDDVSRTIGVSTPVIGYRELLKIATRYAITSPEDSDANAMFAALQIYEKLSKSIGKENVEVALLTGTPSEGIEADIKITSELDIVMSTFNADSAILVSDGPTDEQILPVIQSRIPVISVRRVVVQQSRGIEESFVLVTRYLKKLFEEERYRKYSLGIPGTLALLYAILIKLGATVQEIWIWSTAIIGLILLVKAFSLDERVIKLYNSAPISFIAVVVSILIVALDVTLIAGKKGFEVNMYDPSFIVKILALNLGGPLYSVDLLIVATLFVLGGRIAEAVLSESGRMPRKDVLLFTFIVCARQSIYEGLRVLCGSGDLVYMLYWLGISFMITALVAGVFVIRSKISRSLQ